MQRVVGAAQRGRPRREALDSLARQSAPIAEETGKTCQELAKAPWRAEPLRRAPAETLGTRFR